MYVHVFVSLRMLIHFQNIQVLLTKFLSIWFATLVKYYFYNYSKISEDLILYNSKEFEFIEFADAYRYICDCLFAYLPNFFSLSLLIKISDNI